MLEPFGTASLPERIWDEENIMPLGANKAAIMGVAGVSGVESTIALLATTTATNTAAIEFKTLINSSYREYVFRYYTVNPATDEAIFGFQVSVDGGDNYGQTITSTFFRAFHHESGGTPNVLIYEGFDLAAATGQKPMTETQGNAADECAAGELHLFNPASTTYVKHFHGRSSHMHPANVSIDAYFSGYINTTTAINAIKFYASTGNIDGKIKMWGVP